MLLSATTFANEVPALPAKKGSILLSGKIYDNQNQELLAGVKIVCNNCSKTFYSDLDGTFFIYLETENASDLKLEFSQIGYNSKTIAVKDLQPAGDGIAIDLKAE